MMHLKNKKSAINLILLSTSLLLGVAGCSNLKVIRTERSTSIVKDSLFYALPQREFWVSANFRVNACDTDKKAPDISIEPSLTTSIVADDELRFRINYNGNASNFADIDYTVALYETGTLRSFNGTITDQIGPTIATTIGTVARVATLAVAGLQQGSSVTCTGNTRNLLDVVNAYERKFITGEKPPKPTSEEASEYNSSLKKLRSASTVRWIPSASNRSIKLEIPAELRSLFNIDAFSDFLPQVTAEISSIIPQVPAEKRALLDGEIDGLVIRDAPQAIVRVCVGTCGTLDAPNADNVKIQQSNPMPQFGQFTVLPLRHGFLQTKTVTVELNENGSITKLAYKATNANTDVASKLGTSVEAVGTTLTTSRNSLTSANKNLADCLTAQKSIRDNKGQPIGTCE